MSNANGWNKRIFSTAAGVASLAVHLHAACQPRQRGGRWVRRLTPTRFDRLFTGVSTVVPAGLDALDRTGKEGIGPDDTYDADCGALLEQAAGRVKVVASPGGTARSWTREIPGKVKAA